MTAPTTARPRRTARPVPQRDDALAHLTLQALRSYRSELQQEETQVSYWRRLVQARIDLLRADPFADLMSHLRGVLADAPILSRRQALVDADAVDDIPPLPDLAALWAREVDGFDPHVVEQVLGELAEAEATLSSYRRALHDRLDAATRELVARYHEDPQLSLCALPLDRS